MRTFVNDRGHPVVQFQFDNGWTASVCKRWSNDVMNISMAHWQTDNEHGTIAIHSGSEMSDNEAVAELYRVQQLPPVDK